ncbi:vacuolar (H+)-ATPase G subunit [Medicago truncatula]|uniref:V-type proton ATPase subunit G n=1 Tax=Medicago truncatula TaxID=3880 RepID=A0A072TXH8_MEDTR|nr:vacuolar (H+)-ATPase G subunit [Medicago truncatula]
MAEKVIRNVKVVQPKKDDGKNKEKDEGKSNLRGTKNPYLLPMDPFKGQGGIQMLLTAEQEAQHIVSNARNLRTQRLKQAKDEAEREAAQYRSHMEEEYQKSLTETTGSSGLNVKRLDQETDTKIGDLKQSGSKVSTEVVDMLLKYVTNIKT